MLYNNNNNNILLLLLFTFINIRIIIAKNKFKKLLKSLRLILSLKMNFM